MRKIRGRLLLTVPFLLCLTMCGAQLKLAAVFADHMVLQRRMRVPVWGWAQPGARVTIHFNTKTATATADAKGYWIGHLEPMEALAQGSELNVRVAGSDPLVIHDVLVGEVWLCSGQSNMRMEMAYRDNTIPGVVDWENEVKKAEYPAIRFYNRFRQKGASAWETCDPGSVRNFSAVAYYFGVEIWKSQQVPVGLVHQSAGGTSIQKWIPPGYFEELPWAKQYLDFSQYVPWGDPSSCYNNFIAPLAGFAIRGAIWYQGESNANSEVHAWSYRHLLPLLIRSWRKEWGQGDFPFAFVQLPLWDNSTAFRYIREAQLLTVKTVVNTGLVTTYDKTAYRDMLHPREKKPVGERLAQWAKSAVYGNKNITATGPVYEKYEKTGSSITVFFDKGQHKLQPGDGGPLRGFQLAGADGRFKDATAVINGADKLQVSNASIKDPVAVRYTWGENIGPGNLVNGDGLPASPFRTDTWQDDSLLQNLLTGSELRLAPMNGHWMAAAEDIATWMPANQPAKAGLNNTKTSVEISTNRNGRGGLQGPFIMQVDFSKKPLIKLNNLQLGTAQGWTLALLAPGKEQVILKDKAVETGNITVDIASCIRQHKSRDVTLFETGKLNSIAVVLYAVSEQRKGTLALDSIEIIYEKK